MRATKKPRKKPRKSHEKVTSENVTSNEKSSETQNTPRPLKEEFYGHGFSCRKNAFFRGADKIGAAISGPGIADKNFMDTRIFLSLPESGKRKEHKPKLLVPEIFGWGGGLPREGMGAKKFGMSKPGKPNLLGGISRNFGWDIPAVPKKFENRKVSVYFWPLSKSVNVKKEITKPGSSKWQFAALRFVHSQDIREIRGQNAFKAQMHLSRNCAFRNKTNLPLELARLRRTYYLKHSSHGLSLLRAGLGA